MWLLGERRLEGKLEQEQEGRTLSRLRLPVSREDDGRILKCEARHEALTESLRAEAPLTIQCEKLKKKFQKKSGHLLVIVYEYSCVYCILGCKDFVELISAGPHIVANVNIKRMLNYLLNKFIKSDNLLNFSSRKGK